MAGDDVPFAVVESLGFEAIEESAAPDFRAGMFEPDRFEQQKIDHDLNAINDREVAVVVVACDGNVMAADRNTDTQQGIAQFPGLSAW
ncbi:MAG: hypothetical protein GDA49_04405 [Rhodospirillales bacterium]|nr:hypothetical protein [Rhodospirillales bacterium]